jgi:hypothetical protein
MLFLTESARHAEPELRLLRGNGKDAFAARANHLALGGTEGKHRPLYDYRLAAIGTDIAYGSGFFLHGDPVLSIWVGSL